jgi:hypothetical protein
MTTSGKSSWRSRTSIPITSCRRTARANRSMTWFGTKCRGRFSNQTLARVTPLAPNKHHAGKGAERRALHDGARRVRELTIVRTPHPPNIRSESYLDGANRQGQSRSVAGRHRRGLQILSFSFECKIPTESAPISGAFFSYPVRGHVADGSKADKPSRAKIYRCPLFAKSGQTRARLDCPLCANR